MNETTEICRMYYEKSQSRPHSKRTELAVEFNASGVAVAIDCGCGTGGDIEYLSQQGCQVHGFDINPDSVAICRNRFADNARVDISESSFESFDYPQAGLVIANSSLFFAEPDKFDAIWGKLKSSLEVGGVFAGDFMGVRDSWASHYRGPTAPLSEPDVRALFSDFDVISFFEREDDAKTSLGKMKHWHIYSVVAVRRV